MAEELPDAPWVTKATSPPESLPDAPWTPMAQAQQSELPDAPWVQPASLPQPTETPTAVSTAEKPATGLAAIPDIASQAWQDIKNIIPGMAHLPEQAGLASEQWRMGERTPEAAATVASAAAPGVKLGRVPFRTGMPEPIAGEIPKAAEAQPSGGPPTEPSVTPPPPEGGDPILSRIGQEPKKPLIPSFNRLYTMLKDDLNPIREARNILTEGEAVPAERDPYVLARLTRGSYGKAEAFLDHNTFDPETGKDIGPGLKKILAPVAEDLNGFRKYMLSRRAVELHGRDIETGIPIEEARKTVAEGADKYSKPFQRWVQYHRQLLNYMVRSGIVGRDQAQAMMEANKDYTPFYRVMEEPTTTIGGPGAGIKVRNPIRGMSGSARQILDPIESTIKNTYLYISLADRNIALRALKNLADSAGPRGAEVLQKVKREVHPVRVTGEETGRALAGMGHNMPPEPIDDFTIFRPNAFRPAPDEIAMFNNGKREVFKTDPYLAAAVNGLDRESLGLLTKIVSAPAKLLRAGATLSPEFIARNPIRDQFSAFVFSALGRGYVPFYDFAKGLGSVLKQDQHYQNWLKSGGANSALVSIDRNYIENLVRRLQDPTIMGTLKNVVRSPLDLLRAASELMENATRVGENRRLLARGESLPAAGYGSREVTLDFQRIGSKMRAVNSMIAFFNAQVEGVDRAVRSMATQPLRFGTTVGAAITLPSIYTWWANKDDPRMKEIPRWEKDLFWIIPTDKWETVTAQEAQKVPAGYARQNQYGQWEINKGNIYRIPKPFELGVMFGSVPERILEAYYNHDPNAFKNMSSSLRQAFSPSYVPQAGLPFLEDWANKSFFTGRPLIPKYLENLMPQYQANPYTHDTAKMIGNFISKIPGMSESSFASPIMVENYIRSWTGGLGQHAMDASDWTMRQVGLTPSKIEPTPTNSDRTLLKAFAVRFPEAGANSIQDFYEEYDRRAKAKKTYQYLTKAREAEAGQAILRNNVLATADGLHRAIGAQFKLVRDVYRNPKMTPDEKRKFIDMSYLQMIKMAQTGNMVFDKTKAAFEEKRNAP